MLYLTRHAKRNGDWTREKSMFNATHQFKNVHFYSFNYEFNFVALIFYMIYLYEVNVDI